MLMMDFLTYNFDFAFTQTLLCTLYDGIRRPSSDEMIWLLSEVETCINDTPVIPYHTKRDLGSLTVSLAIALCK